METEEEKPQVEEEKPLEDDKLQLQARDTRSPQTLEEAGRIPHPRAIGGAWSCQHLGLLASRTMREYIYVVLSPQFVVICYSSCRTLIRHLIYLTKPMVGRMPILQAEKLRPRV